MDTDALGLDAFLAAAAVTIAIVGILWDNPPPIAKIGLITLAVLSGGATLIKSYGDEVDKNFLKKALISTLKPSNADFEKFGDEIAKHAKDHGFSHCHTYHHSDDGMTCFLTPYAPIDKLGTIVLNKSDLSEIYANLMEGKDNKESVSKIFNTVYTPSAMAEEFKDKIGILGFHIFYNMFGEFPNKIEYDDSFGVYVEFGHDERKQKFEISPAELHEVTTDKSPVLFHAIEQLWRMKYNAGGQVLNFSN